MHNWALVVVAEEVVAFNSDHFQFEDLSLLSVFIACNISWRGKGSD